MMSIQSNLQKELQDEIRRGDIVSDRREALKVIIGELQRQHNKILSDEDAIKVLKKLEKYELELLESTGKSDSEFLNILRENLPHMTSRDDIERWIEDNVDFSTFKNKMQAVGVVMKHFGASADGNQVREIIQKL